MIRRFGEPVKTGQRYKRRPGAYVILIRDGSILLTHQAEPIPEFQLPGGGIDPGEAMIPALHREVLEETGWAMDAPRRIGAFRRFTYMPEYDLWAEKVCQVFRARPTVRRSEPLEDGHTAVWMSPVLAIDAIENEGDRAFLRKVLR